MIMNQRSDVYYKAGLELLSKRLYSQSIACFYYSVLQKMWYSLTVSPLRPMAYENQNPLDENIHERTLEDITLRLIGRKDIEKRMSYFVIRCYHYVRRLIMILLCVLKKSVLNVGDGVSL